MRDYFKRDYIGGNKWKLSDEIYLKLTGKKVNSKYNPKISVCIKELPKVIPKKKLFGLFWSTPTFKDTDCYYLFHVYDKTQIDFVISTSSANTVESMARVIKEYNHNSKKNIKALLFVPELSAYKVAESAIHNNPYIHYIILKNSTLDSIRAFAQKLNKFITNKKNVVSSDVDLKTSAYAQIGFLLNDYGILNEECCFVQTVSGGIGPAGLIESAYKLKVNPEILIVQPKNNNSTPIVDALTAHLDGKNPLSIFEHKKYETSDIEPTLGSTKPIYAIEKFIKWRENEGEILSILISKEELFQYQQTILKFLVKAGIYPKKNLGQKLFNLEKSGFIAFAGALKAANKIKSKNIIVNFTGRYLDNDLKLPTTALPHIIFNPAEGYQKLLSLMKII
ncbi:MAG: hypothetical protein ACTSPD_11825 [Promethearchaeota archaeon]